MITRFGGPEDHRLPLTYTASPLASHVLFLGLGLGSGLRGEIRVFLAPGSKKFQWENTYSPCIILISTF